MGPTHPHKPRVLTKLCSLRNEVELPLAYDDGARMAIKKSFN